MKRLLLPCSLVVLLLTSCFGIDGERIKGNGNRSVREQSLSGLSSLSVSGAFSVVLAQGPASLRVEADENLQEYIEVENSGGRLEISTRDGYNLRPSRDITLYVTAPELSSVELSGASNLRTSALFRQPGALQLILTGASEVDMQVDMPRIGVEITGSGSARMAGATRDLAVDITGAGSLQAEGLKSETARIEVSGAGEVDLFASKTLDVEVSGAGDVRYSGNPQVNKRISGAGEVVQKTSRG